MLPQVAVLAALALVARAAPSTPLHPLLSAEDAHKIPGHYMVVLRDDATETHVADHHNWLSTVVGMRNDAQADDAALKNRVKHVYDFEGLKGYAGKFEPEVVEAIRRSKHVAYVEQDQIVKAWEVQHDAPWGLSRVAHHTRPTQDHYTEYPYVPTAGENVTVYVVDTGINIHHVDFEGRASWGATIPENDEDVDGNGHGTHCAGTIAGKKYGVAKKAHVVAVKVLSSNGSGTMSDVVRGVEYVTRAHKARGKGARSAANMSLGGGRSRTLDRAVNAAVDAGVHFAVAAGNDNRPACNYSPAAAEKAVTVGATTVDDRMAWFSNHGKCVDVFAPGKDITSTWIGSNVATNTISGTSMASPHVAGLMAYLLSQLLEPVTPEELKNLIIKTATKDTIKGLPKPPKKGGNPGRDNPKWPFPWPPPSGGNSGTSDGKTPNRLIFTGYKGADDPHGSSNLVLRPIPDFFEKPQPVNLDEESLEEDLDAPVHIQLLTWVRRTRVRLTTVFF